MFFESLDEMIRAKLRDYSAQSLTYEQAAEELVADAWRGIFDSEESFKRWVTFQRGQAEKNAGKSGRTFYEATCAGCGGIARVPFEPKEDRPVYCSDCFAKMRGE